MNPYAHLTPEFADEMLALARHYGCLLFLVRRGDGWLQPLLLPIRWVH